MAKENVVSIELEKISNKFDVRTKLDDDRMLQFAGMYESGMELPPITVVKTGDDSYAYVDGRHRGAARAFLDLKNVMAVVLNGSLSENPAELFARALEANWGGSKPPTRSDIEHTITRMLECGVSQTSIRERLQFLPGGALKAYISAARTNITRRKISRALDEIGEGYSLTDAAKRAGLKEEILKDVVKGNKRKFGHSRNDEDEYLNALLGYVSTQLRATNTGISKKMTFLLEKVELGEVSSKNAAKVLLAWKEHLRKTSLRITDWQSRLNALEMGMEKSVSVGD